MARLIDYARLVRIPNVFTAMADIGLAALATGALPDQTLRFVLILLCSASMYLAGMVWNDYFDIEQDRKERPFRPLPSGRIELRTARWLGLGLFALGLAAAALADVSSEAYRGRTTLIAVLLLVAILLYDGWLKRTLLGPVAMGSCRFLDILLGLSVSPEPIAAWGWLLALVIGVYIVGVTWFARTEARDSSVPMLRAAAATMLGAVVLSLAVAALYQDAAPAHAIHPLFPYFLVAFIFYLGLPVLRALARPVPERVQKAVKRAVLGLVLLDAILATALAGWIGLLLALLLLPAAWLGKWVYST